MPTQVSLLDGALASAGTLAIQTNGTTSAITISSAQVATFVNNPIMTGLTASRAVFTDGSKGLTSNAITGTGNVVMSASPTLTGTIDGAALTLSSSLTLSGGTANGVLYLNGSKVATSGSALTFDGSFLNLSRGSAGTLLNLTDAVAQTFRVATTASTVNLDSASGGSLAFLIGSSEQMRLTSTGLGIGTSSPSQRLHVTGSSSATTVGTAATIQITSSTGLTFPAGDVYLQAVIDSATPGDRGTALALFTGRQGVGITERARIDSLGNLGLGVTPSAGYRASIKGNYSSIVGGIEFDNGGGDKTVLGFASATSPSFIISNQSASGVLRFDTNNTERARIDSSGNLLVGTTSSTVWNGSAGTKVVVGGSGNTITSLQSSTTTVDQGAIFEGYATGISSNSAALGSIAFLRSNTSTTALSSYTAFYTNNAGTVAERARITSGGDLLVGTTSSAANSGTGVKLLPSGYVYVVAPSTTSDTYNYYNSTAGAYRFYVTNAGVINATSTTITAISDQRLKENIQDIDVGLDAVMALKPRKFDWKAGKGKDKKGDRGWIAQEFEQVFPDMITTWKDEPPEGEEPYKAVNADLIPVLVKAIQELKAEFDAYKATHP